MAAFEAPSCTGLSAPIQDKLVNAQFLCGANREFLLTEARLGRGSFGRVTLGYRALPDGLFEWVAVKQVCLNPMAPQRDLLKCVEDVVREVAFHRLLADSPHVLSLRGSCWFCPQQGTISIPMSRCHGTLDAYAMGIRFVYPPGVLSCLFRQCIEALRDIHAKAIVHRDIKPENILVQPPNTPNGAPLLLVADFGLSRRAGDLRVAHSTAGSMPFMSLDALSGAGQPHPEALDIWAMGCTFFFLLSGDLPFGGSTINEVRCAVGHGVRKVRTSALTRELRESEEVKHLVPLVFSMFTLDPAKRPTAAELLRDMDVALASMSLESAAVIQAQQRSIQPLIDGVRTGVGAPRFTRMVACRADRPVPIFTGGPSDRRYTGIDVQPGRDILVDMDAYTVSGSPATAPLCTPLRPSRFGAGAQSAAATAPLPPSQPREESAQPLAVSGTPGAASLDQEWVPIAYPIRGHVACAAHGHHLLHKVHGTYAAMMCAPLIPRLRTPQPGLPASPDAVSLSPTVDSLAFTRMRMSPHGAALSASPSPRRPVAGAVVPLHLPVRLPQVAAHAPPAVVPAPMPERPKKKKHVFGDTIKRLFVP